MESLTCDCIISSTGIVEVLTLSESISFVTISIEAL